MFDWKEYLKCFEIEPLCLVESKCDEHCSGGLTQLKSCIPRSPDSLEHEHAFRVDALSRWAITLLSESTDPVQFTNAAGVIGYLLRYYGHRRFLLSREVEWDNSFEISMYTSLWEYRGTMDDRTIRAIGKIIRSIHIGCLIRRNNCCLGEFVFLLAWTGSIQWASDHRANYLSAKNGICALRQLRRNVSGGEYLEHLFSSTVIHNMNSWYDNDEEKEYVRLGETMGGFDMSSQAARLLGTTRLSLEQELLEFVESDENAC